MSDRIESVDPSTMPRSAVFTQATLVQAGPLLFVGGQNGTDEQGHLREGIEAQSAQAVRNLVAVLAAAGCTLADLAALTVHLVDGQELGPAFAAAQQVADLPRTAITVVRVAGLARPGALIELSAVAAAPG